MSGKEKDTDGICILSFDNGGPGTYSQLLILKEYMNRLASDSQVAKDDIYPADHFDLMGGVGFGGFVAFMLGHLRMNVNQAIEDLFSVTAVIFLENSDETIDREANSRSLKQFVEDMLQARGISLDTKMNDERYSIKRSKVALYAATSANLTHPHIFRTYTSRSSGFNPTIVEALCATMSTQSHFSPVKIGPPRRQQLFVGGALGSNNPTRLLLDEASMLFGKDRRVAQILSLGCGVPRVLSADSSSELNIDQILKEITTDCGTVAYDLSARLFNIDAYLRLNVDRGMEDVRMKDWDNLGAIESHTATYLAAPGTSGAVDSSIRHIKERIASVSLGQLNQSSSAKVMTKKAPSVSSYFVPRRKPWDSMIHHLVTSPFSRQRIFPITGMGGCGKTQLVSYFLQEHPDLYNQTIYVDASSSSSIQADLQTWVRTLGDGHERDVWEDAMRILSNCPQGEQWALVLDNADDPQLRLRPYLSKSANVTILITSRNRDLGSLSTTHHLELGEMSNEEALAALLKAARRQTSPSDEELESAQTLIKELGCLAVALVQAGTYCYRLSSTVGDILRPYTFTQYLSLFASHRAKLMKKIEPTSLDSYERGVYTTLDLSYKELPRAPRDFLHLISFFHHTDIPLEAFAIAAKNRFQDLRVYLSRPDCHNDTILRLERTLYHSGEWDELWVQEIVQTLHSFSLLTISSMNNSVFLNLHPLIQKWSRDMDLSASTHFKAMVTPVFTASATKDNVKLNRNILPHILDVLSRTELKDLHVNDLMTFGIILKDQGHYQKAEQLVHNALETIEASEGSESVTTLDVYEWLGMIYRDEGKWDEAERLLEAVLQKRRRFLGMEYPDTVLTEGELALTYYYRGRYGEAEKLQVEVLEKRRRILGMEHPESITAAANLASTYAEQKHYEEAENLQVEVLEQRRRILGMEHPETIRAAANLASTYNSYGRYGEAEKLEVEVLEQSRRILGMEHPDTIMAAANLAVTYADQGRYEEAEILGVKVLEQRRQSLGIEHRDTIIAAANLATIYADQGRYEEAENLQVEILIEQRRWILGMEHPEAITTAANLASTYHSQGKWNEAEELEAEVLEQRRRILGMEHPDTILAMANLAVTYGKQGRWEDAVALHAPAIQLSLKVLGREHPETQQRIDDLVYVYDTLGKQKEAEEMKSLLL